jgi:hypothetical protein
MGQKMDLGLAKMVILTTGASEGIGTTSSMSLSKSKKFEKFIHKLSFLQDPKPSDFGKTNIQPHLGNLES